MNRFQLEHVLEACSRITNSNEILVLGSQAIHGLLDPPPPELTTSMEADLFPLDKPELEPQIEGSLGELSHFHDSHGYYAHGISLDLVILPEGWQNRLKKLEGVYKDVSAYCLSLEDLVISKLAAGRDKDIEFTAALYQNNAVDRQKLKELIERVPQEWQNKITENLAVCIGRMHTAAEASTHKAAARKKV